jgi:hypothetical protein
MKLCIAAIAVTNSSRHFNFKLRPAMKRNDGIDLLEGRVPVGSKEIGERVQYGIGDVDHGQRPIPKRLK